MIANTLNAAVAAARPETGLAGEQLMPHDEHNRLVEITVNVEAAATLLSFIVADNGIPARIPVSRRVANPNISTSLLWSWHVMSSCRARLKEMSPAIDMLGAPDVPPSVFQKAMSAIGYLLPLTSGGQHVSRLLTRDRQKGIREVINQLNVLDKELESTQELLVVTDSVPTIDNKSDQASSTDSGFSAVRDALLERAGGALSLTTAATAMGITRQALHKKLKSGGALGMMLGNEIIVPTLQFLDGTGKATGKKIVLPGIDRVTRLFEETKAGPWSALQFLIDKDPNLRCPPIEALRSADPNTINAVEHAARAYLGEDEG